MQKKTVKKAASVLTVFRLVLLMNACFFFSYVDSWPTTALWEAYHHFLKTLPHKRSILHKYSKSPVTLNMSFLIIILFLFTRLRFKYKYLILIVHSDSSQPAGCERCQCRNNDLKRAIWVHLYCRLLQSCLHLLLTIFSTHQLPDLPFSAPLDLA